VCVCLCLCLIATVIEKCNLGRTDERGIGWYYGTNDES
jgi:hypothetical protein